MSLPAPGAICLLLLLLAASAQAQAQSQTPAERELEQARQRIAAQQAQLRSQKVAFGEWLPVQLYLGPDSRQIVRIEVRPLYIKGDIERFTTGEPYEIDERYFVVRSAYRIDDVPPADPRAEGLRWSWQRGPWVMVDRQRTRVRDLELPDFDPYYSQVTWYRDLAAYCGLGREAQQVLAVVAQAGKKRPIVRQPLAEASGLPAPDSECDAPRWAIVNGELRVTFEPRNGRALTYAIDGDKAEPRHEAAQESQAR